MEKFGQSAPTNYKSAPRTSWTTWPGEAFGVHYIKMIGTGQISLRPSTRFARYFCQREAARRDLIIIRS